MSRPIQRQQQRHTFSGDAVVAAPGAEPVPVPDDDAVEEEGKAAGHRPSTARLAIPWMCGSSSSDRASRDVVRSMPVRAW